MMFLDTTLPDALLTRMLNDTSRTSFLRREQDKFHDTDTQRPDVARESPEENRRLGGWMTYATRLPIFTHKWNDWDALRAWSARMQVT